MKKKKSFITKAPQKTPVVPQETPQDSFEFEFETSENAMFGVLPFDKDWQASKRPVKTIGEKFSPLIGEILQVASVMERLRKEWHKIFEPDFAKNTYPLKIREKKLFIHVNGSTRLYNYIRFEQKRVLARVQQFNIDAVSFTTEEE